MARIIHDEVPVFVPMALTMEQAEAAFLAVRAMFMATHNKDLAQAMVEIGDAIDKKRKEIKKGADDVSA